MNKCKKRKIDFSLITVNKKYNSNENKTTADLYMLILKLNNIEPGLVDIIKLNFYVNRNSYMLFRNIYDIIDNGLNNNMLSHTSYKNNIYRYLSMFRLIYIYRIKIVGHKRIENFILDNLDRIINKKVEEDIILFELNAWFYRYLLLYLDLGSMSYIFNKLEENKITESENIVKNILEYGKLFCS
jgi:hypothetical protein